MKGHEHVWMLASDSQIHVNCQVEGCGEERVYCGDPLTTTDIERLRGVKPAYTYPTLDEFTERYVIPDGPRSIASGFLCIATDAEKEVVLGPRWREINALAARSTLIASGCRHLDDLDAFLDGTIEDVRRHQAKRLPRGWRCRRHPAHAGPCALVPKWWNVWSWLDRLDA